MNTLSDWAIAIAESTYQAVYTFLSSPEDPWQALAVSSGVKSAVLLAAAGLATCFLRSAATRHMVWTLTTVSLLLLPPLTLWLPTLSLPAPHERLAVASKALIPGDEVSRPFFPDLSAVESPAARPAEDRRALVEASFAARPIEQNPTVFAAESRPAGSLSIWAMIWATGMAWLSMSYCRDLRQRRRLTANARPIQDQAWRSMVDELSGSLAIGRRVRLLAGPGVPVPMTWGILRPTILLPDDAASWPTERRRHVLLHELSHIRRRDVLTQNAARLTRAIYWFNPLVWWAERRLRIESEHACDDLVLSAGSRPSAYADHLLAAARSLRGGVPATAVAMARRSKLGDRIQAILDPNRTRSPLTLRRLIVAGSLTAGLTLPLAAAVPEPPAPPEPPTPPAAPIPPTAPIAPVPPKPTVAPVPPTPPVPPVLATPPTPPTPPETPEPPEPTRSFSRVGVLTDDSPLYTERCGEGGIRQSFQGRNGDYLIEIEVGRCRFDIEMRGEIEFSPDEDRVERMDRRAYLAIDEKIGRERRRIEVSAGDDGQPEHAWFVDGEKQPFDDPARAWLREALPLIFRATGIDAPARVGRILARAGIDGVLTEVPLILGDHVQRIYLEELLEQAEMNAEDLARALYLAGRELGSDHELAELLTGLSSDDLEPSPVRLAFVEATRSIGSDHELRRSLAALLERELPSEVLDAILESAQTIGSDFEMAELLIELTARGLTPGATFFDALETIGSDYELRRVLAATADRVDLTSELVSAMLETSLTIGSDQEMAELLVQLARSYPIEDDLRDRFLQALESVGSEHQRGRVLAALNG